ncbi:hypothetical protein JYG23_06700 [Sedimentibacter sp. zth1]|uniref:DUF6143 family protein n=1 Tax=Sedimentibacter sp. zth1 TaxID=2816908 RepID=UPI001A930E2C|nr:DUF6143 family protein [Sedimentibacter sp. zth1]QSX07068.1 hypothetical protein JYG23_06700 [Sedimentibacter sp. zth1]
MKYYTNINNDNIIKQPKIHDLNYANIDEEYRLRNKNVQKNFFVVGTPQLSIGKFQWSALYNPKNSKTSLFVDETCAVNFSSSPIIESFYINPSVCYEGLRYMYGTPSSLEYQYNSSGVVIMYQGSNNMLSSNESNSLRILQPYYTDTVQRKGTIVISPGKSILLLVSSINSSSPSCAFSFYWWEEK